MLPCSCLTFSHFLYHLACCEHHLFPPPPIFSSSSHLFLLPPFIPPPTFSSSSHLLLPPFLPPTFSSSYLLLLLLPSLPPPTFSSSPTISSHIPASPSAVIPCIKSRVYRRRRSWRRGLLALTASIPCVSNAIYLSSKFSSPKTYSLRMPMDIRSVGLVVW